MLCAVALFLVLEGVLTVMIQCERGLAFTRVAFFAVICACLFNLVYCRCGRVFLITQSALICTVIADVFLLVLDTGYVVGVSFFIAVQLLYASWIYTECKSEGVRRAHLIARIALTLVALVLPAIILGDRVDLLSTLSIVCFTNLVLNVVFSFFNFWKDPILPIALILFMLCDAIVGFMNMGAYFSFSEGDLGYYLMRLGAKGAWLFYAPSQALLAISLLPDWLKKWVAERENDN